MRMTIGANIGADGEGMPQSDLVLLWGTNTLTANPHLWPFVLKARENGARVIAIDPIRTRTADQCDEWIGIRPGTDAALALGMMNVIFAEGLQDDDYLARYTLGARELRERRPGVPAVARRLDHRTHGRPHHGAGPCVRPRESRVRSHQLRAPASRRRRNGRPHHRVPPRGDRALAPRRAAACSSRPARTSSSTSTRSSAPISPPSGRLINMIRLGEALTRRDAGVGGPPVKALVVYNSNPAAVAPDSNEVLRGLAREDLFTVVLEHFQTDTADWADWVLPATTQLEHWDVHLSYGHLYVTLNRPAIAPMGEAKPNSEIFRLLAARMGMDHPALKDDDVTIIRQALDTTSETMKGVTFDALMANGWVRLNLPVPYLPFAEGRLPHAERQVRVRLGAHAGNGARSAARRSRRRTNSRRAFPSSRRAFRSR